MISKLSSHLGPGSILLSSSFSPSLILHLDAGNTFSYIGTGSTWYDLTNLNNDIELSNTTFDATYNQLSQFKGSFEFNGSNSGGALISGTAIPLMNSHYTIESWIQLNNPYGDGGIIGWGNYGSIGEANVLRQLNSGFENYWIVSSLTASATFSTDYWYHLASTYDGTNRTIYLNGQSLGTDIPGFSHSVPYFNNLTVGVANATEFFDGRLGMIKVWNKNLNSTQLLSAFNSDKSKYGYDFGSMTFDETQSSYLISNLGDYAFGTNDFTVESFFNSSTSSNNLSGIISLRGSSASAYMDGVSINLTSADTSTPLIEFSAGGELLTYTSSIDEWYHVAISRVGSTSSFFVNGNLFNEVADTLNYGNNDLVVGRYYTDVNDYYFNGIISNVRVISGIGLYTSSFTPPSTPLSVTQSNTKLLISSQEISPSADLTGIHSVTASNIGWTSSLPYIVPPYVTDHLELYVDAGLPSSYPGSGTTLYDLSPNGFDMNIGTGSVWSSTLGGVIDFDGSYSGPIDLDGPVSGLNIVSVTHSTGYTMETMVKFNTVSTTQGIFTFCGGPWGNSGYIDLQLEGSSLRWEAITGGGSSFYPTYTFATGTWYHIVATYDGSFLVVYVNGTMVGSSSQPGSINTSSTAKFVLGSWDGKLNGSIGFARFYSKPLLADDVTTNFDNNKTRFGL